MILCKKLRKGPSNVYSIFWKLSTQQRAINADDLSTALSKISDTRVKLGVMAIDAGYMTAQDVDRVHARQQREDKRFGDLAVELNCLTQAQLDQLLGAQKPAQLVLGQVLVDMGLMTNAEFENALIEYKEQYKLDILDESSERREAVARMIAELDITGHSENQDYISDYIMLFFKNLIRFIGSDFVPIGTQAPLLKYDFAVTQKIEGKINATTAVMFEGSALAFASRFAGEEITGMGELAEASISEFLNLLNGLFAVNMSDNHGIELSLLPQEIVLHNLDFCNANTVTIGYSFGRMHFAIIEN